jgi:type I restriction-modification system DNA methylase subunit
LRQEDIDLIIDTYRNRKEVPKYSNLASLEFIAENEYNLNIPRYVNTFEEEEKIDDSDYLLSGKIFLPTPIEEQKKITDFLIQIDSRIAQLKEKKENLELYKKGITQKIFSQKLRFKDENGKDFS